jgi:hypothetical protein
MRVDNLQMDMTGVELLVANAHHQVQCVEDEVVKLLSERVSAMYQDFFTFGGAMESRLEGMCVDNKESLVKLLDAFVCLDRGIKNNTNQIVWLDNNQEWLERWEKGMNDLVGEVCSLQETVQGQSATITALKDCIRELELGHGILQDCVIHIEVGGQ